MILIQRNEKIALVLASPGNGIDVQAERSDGTIYHRRIVGDGIYELTEFGVGLAKLIVVPISGDDTFHLEKIVKGGDTNFKLTNAITLDGTTANAWVTWDPSLGWRSYAGIAGASERIYNPV